MSGKNTAFTKFAIPDPGTRNSANGDNEKVDNNRWYRLLGLVEIPTGAQQVLRDSLINLRTPGKINLNTIRHPGVLAALIDDDFHLDTFRQPRDVVVDSDAVKATYAWLQLREPVELPNGATISREPNRHWYEQFMFSRDRRDPYTGLTLPGIPGSRPFRPFHYTNIYSGADANLYRDSVASVEHTMLRSLPIFNGAGLGENLDAQGVPGLDSGSGWGTRTVTFGSQSSQHFLVQRSLIGDQVFAVGFHHLFGCLNLTLFNRGPLCFRLGLQLGDHLFLLINILLDGFTHRFELSFQAFTHLVDILFHVGHMRQRSLGLHFAVLVQLEDGFITCHVDRTIIGNENRLRFHINGPDSRWLELTIKDPDFTRLCDFGYGRTFDRFFAENACPAAGHQQSAIRIESNGSQLQIVPLIISQG